MQTHNYKIDLMIPNQASKDIVFNESMLKIDSFLNSAVTGFATAVPENLAAGEKYIITEGERKNQICYKPHESKPISFVTPKNGAVFFVLGENAFFCFNEDQWNIIASPNFGANPIYEEKMPAAAPVVEAAAKIDFVSANERFTAIQDVFALPRDANHFYLYLNGDSEISLAGIKAREITLLIKQNYASTFNLTWPHNILWQDKTPHKITSEANSVDIVRLYRLIETEHFLGQILGQNYKF